MSDSLSEAGPLFAALRQEAGEVWRAYSHHAFVAGLADGSLPAAAFRHYLIQDYIFLINFARAYALGVYKAETIDEMRHCQATATAILDGELALHIGYCREWGLEETDVLLSLEDPANLAYTRYVLDRGLAGDFLDLLVALAPCAVGYAEIGKRLLASNETRREGNPYWPWIEAYGGEEYQDLGLSAVRQLQSAAEHRLGPDPQNSHRFRHLAGVFRQATSLEVAFWQMGLDAAE